MAIIVTPETRIQQELKQSRPFKSRAEACLVALMRTADLVRQSVETVVAANGVSIAEYNVLRILRGAGDTGLREDEIAARTIDRPADAGALLEGLIARRWVWRAENIHRLTSEGLTFVKKLDDPVLAMSEAALSSLSLRDMAALLELLDNTRDGLHSFLAK